MSSHLSAKEPLQKKQDCAIIPLKELFMIKGGMMKRLLKQKGLLLLAGTSIITAALVSNGAKPIRYMPLQDYSLTLKEGDSMNKQEGIPKPIEPEIGIAPKDLVVSCDVLNKLLATEFTLALQTWGYHWNLVGPEFHDYHILFEGQYVKMLELVDILAERVRAVGGTALGTMTQFLKYTAIKEDTGPIPAPRDMVQTLLANQELLIKLMREGINTTEANRRDMGTSNLLQDIMIKHEKMAWMLRSLLERRSGARKEN